VGAAASPSRTPRSIDPVVINEYVYALETHYQLPRAAIRDLVSALAKTPNVECDRDAVIAAAAEYAESPKLSFTDCYIAERAVVASAEALLIFDHKLVNQHAIARLVVATGPDQPRGKTT
jgi:predicted nucleic-acid-binding protein